MPALSQLATDPEFLNLPVGDRRQIAAEVDPEFGSLPEADQDILLGEVAAKAMGGRPNLDAGLRSFLGGLGDLLSPTTGGVTGPEMTAEATIPAAQRVPSEYYSPGRDVAILAARTVPPIVGGAVAGPPGAIMGGLVGGTLAQGMEQAAGFRDEFSFPRLGADAITSVIPGGRFAGVTSAPARVALRMGQGGATAATAGAITRLSEGVPPTEGLIRDFTIGAGVGGVAGLAEVRRTQALTAKAIEQADDKIAVEGPVGSPEQPPLPHPPGFVRLYRAADQPTMLGPENPRSPNTGRWFTSNKSLAEHIRTENPDQARGIFYVDVPDELAAQYRVNEIGTHVLPREIAATAVPEGAEQFLFAGRLPSELADVGVASLPQKQIADEVKAGGAETARVLAETEAAKGGQRLYLRIAEAFEKGDIDPKSVTDILQRENMSLADFVVHYKSTVQSNARQMQFLSSVAKRLNSLAATDPKVKEIVDSLGPEVRETWLKRAFRFGRHVDDLGRAGLTSNPVTMARNFQSQKGITLTSAVDEAVDAMLRGEGLTGAAREVGHYVPALGRAAAENTAQVMRLIGIKSPKSMQRITSVLDEFPVEAERLMGTPAAEGTLGRVGRVLTVVNNFNERFDRRVMFDARLRSLLAQSGMNVPESLANPATIPDELVTQAVNDSLEGTLAMNPVRGGGKRFMDIWHAFPRPLASITHAFPRWAANAYKYILDHSPAGYLRLMGVTSDELIASDPVKARKILAKAHTGTMLLAGGLAFRLSPYAGDKWWEWKRSADPDDKRSMDIRPFSPFSTYAFLGEVMRQMMANPDVKAVNMTTADWLQGMLSVNRIAGTGLVATDLLRQGSLDRKAQMVGDMVSQYLGRFSVPLGGLKDIIAGTSDPEEAVYRDTRTDEFTTEVGGLPVSAAPFLRNVPKKLADPFDLPSSQDLPAVSSALRTTRLRSEAPLFRQFTGWNLKTKTPSESIVDRLAIETARIVPATGVPEYDRLTATLMAPVVEQIFPMVMGAPAIQRKSVAVQRFVANKILGSIRDDARRQAAAMRPDLATTAQLKGLDSDLRAVLAENSGMLPPDVQKVLEKAGIGSAP